MSSIYNDDRDDADSTHSDQTSIFYEAADSLIEHYNEYLMVNGIDELVTAEDLVILLQSRIDADFLHRHMDSDFAKGLILGVALTEERLDYEAEEAEEV